MQTSVRSGSALAITCQVSVGLRPASADRSLLDRIELAGRDSLTGKQPRSDAMPSLEEVSIRWHPLTATSPDICASVRVVYSRLTAAEIIAAGEANRAQPDEQRLLDSLVREAIGAWKMLGRGAPRTASERAA